MGLSAKQNAYSEPKYHSSFTVDAVVADSGNAVVPVAVVDAVLVGPAGRLRIHLLPLQRSKQIQAPELSGSESLSNHSCLAIALLVVAVDPGQGSFADLYSAPDPRYFHPWVYLSVFVAVDRLLGAHRLAYRRRTVLFVAVDRLLAVLFVAVDRLLAVLFVAVDRLLGAHRLAYRRGN
jgi:hypothetical protein